MKLRPAHRATVVTGAILAIAALILPPQFGSPASHRVLAWISTQRVDYARLNCELLAIALAVLVALVLVPKQAD